MLRSECGVAAESKEENIRRLNGDQRTEGPVEEQSGSKTRKGKTRRRIYYWNGVPPRRTRSWGRMRTDLDVGPVRRGIRRWRDRVFCQGRGKCRVYRVGA